MAWQKGQSGNPGGQRSHAYRVVKEAAQQHGVKCVEVLVALLDSEDEKIRCLAANSLLDRGFGKPAQVIVGDDDEPPVQLRGIVELVRPGG